LKGEIKIVGQGMFEWHIFDVNGAKRSIRTKALFIPEGNIRQFSPQCYFQEHMKGSAKIGATGISLLMPDGTILRFQYASGLNIPIMLTNTKRSLTVGIAYDNICSLADPTIAFAYINMADETNRNLTAAEKELLLWHWRLGHINFQLCQMLLAKP
jgi:hypothetical protein